MGKTQRERMAELPKSEELGTYVAEAARIKAELKLRADIKHIGVISSGSDWYWADVKFFTQPQFQGDEEGYSVTAHYNSSHLDSIFRKLKRAESGFEEILLSSTDHNYKWQERREVMKCILSLEDQTNHLIKERENAANERKKLMYGKDPSLC